MIRQSFKQIIRNLLKHKSFTLINLLGLSLGIAAVVVLFLIAQYENSFDGFHSDSDDVYRLVSQRERPDDIEYNATVPYPAGRFLRDEVPGVKATQIHFSSNKQVQVARQDPFLLENVVFADSLFFDVLDFAEVNNFWIAGNPQTALSVPNTAVLTETSAKEMFGDSNPMGESFKLDNKVELEVVGIIKDVPRVSHLPISILVSYSSLNPNLIGGLDIESWEFTSGGYTYVRLNDQQKPSNLESAFQAMVQRRTTTESSRKEKMYLQPISQIHFDPSFEGSNPSYTVSSRYLTMLILLGGFILLIACVNYVNLSTSFAFTKSKEVGIRKTIGASKKQLFFHYMLETFVLTAFAAIIGVLLAALFIPTVNSILGKSVSILSILDPVFIFGAFVGIILISFISGVYPAMILSGFNPVSSLKNQLAMPGKSSVILRKGLVVFQFTTSIALIICTLVISRQMEFFQQKELGFNKEAVIEVRLPTQDSLKRENFRNLIQNKPGVQQISFCLGAPISGSGLGVSLKAAQLPGDVEYTTRVIPSDDNYKDT
ncbi:MAG TPA: ABC transporter permease, partial [Gillisia sp.]|nr:ABC transporter permease [Gillisia sp.]